MHWGWISGLGLVFVFSFLSISSLIFGWGIFFLKSFLILKGASWWEGSKKMEKICLKYWKQGTSITYYTKNGSLKKFDKKSLKKHKTVQICWQEESKSLKNGGQNVHMSPAGWLKSLFHSFHSIDWFLWYIFEEISNIVSYPSLLHQFLKEESNPIFLLISMIYSTYLQRKKKKLLE